MFDSGSNTSFLWSRSLAHLNGVTLSEEGTGASLGRQHLGHLAPGDVGRWKKHPMFVKQMLQNVSDEKWQND